MKKTKSGFTIVELLIVIVVIAILAAISIVAYNGIQTRAENTKTIQSVNAYSKAISMYVAEKSSLPIQTYSCLGSPAKCGNTTDTTDPGSCGGGQSSPKTLLTNLSPYATSLPEPSTQTMNCGGKQYGGAWYNSSTGLTADIRFYLKGDQPCDTIGRPIASRSVVDDITTCVTKFSL